MHVAVVDVSEPTEPVLVGQHALPANTDGSYYYYYGGRMAPSGSDIVQIGTTLALLRTQYEYSNDYETTKVRSFVDVVDLSDPTAPSSSTLEIPVGLGTTGLVTSENLLALSHYEAADPNGNLVRFYMDRIDVSNPKAPARLSPVNIPGSLLAYDAPSGGAITVDYSSIVKETADSTQCQELFNNAGWWQPYDTVNWVGPGLCSVTKQSIKLVRLGNAFATIEGAHQLEFGENVSQSTTGDDRTFVTLSNYGNYYYAGDCFDCGYYGGGNRPLPLLTIAGLTSGAYALGRVDIEGGDYWSQSGLVASGQRVLLSTGWRGELSVIDASDAAAPEIVRSVPVHGYVQDLDVANGVALASLGYDGAQLIHIAD
jgi:hypothetical protein